MNILFRCCVSSRLTLLPIAGGAGGRYLPPFWDWWERRATPIGPRPPPTPPNVTPAHRRSSSGTAWQHNTNGRVLMPRTHSNTRVLAYTNALNLH